MSASTVISGVILREGQARPVVRDAEGAVELTLNYMSVQLQLLETCNLKCAHCYVPHKARLLPPSTVEVKRRLDAIYAFAYRHGFDPDIHLSGGEPTLRKDLVEIVRHIFDVHDGDALLFTNGTRWSKELAKNLYQAGLRYVQISLEGPEALTDAIRGEGVFGQAMQTLRMLGDEGFRRTVSITVTADNFSSLFDFVDELAPLGIHFHIREVFPIKNGANLLGLNSDQRRQLFEWAVRGLPNARSTLGVEDPAHCSVSPAYARGQAGCVAARNHFCVNVDGTIFPCRPLEYAVGHVDDLEAAWQSTTMVRIRERDFDGQCGRCAVLKHCGGCRVHARLKGDLFGEDTRCHAAENGLIRTKLEHRSIVAAESVGQAIWSARTRLRTLVDALQHRS